MRRLLKIAHMRRQATQEAPVEADIGILEQHGRMRQPGDDPLRSRIRIPGEPAQAFAMA